MDTIRVRMLGDFSISAGDAVITDSDNRAMNIWLLLSYLLCHRSRTVPQKELILLLYGADPKSATPASSLKTALHRTRQMLDRLWPGAGHELIQLKDGGYQWSGKYPVWVDTDEFDRLCQAQGLAGSARLESWTEGLSLYKGDFLSRFSSEAWVMPISAWFHNLAVDTALKALPELISAGEVSRSEELCRGILQLEPYNEQLNCLLMRILMEQNRHKQAVSLYEDLSQQLFSEFGVMPGNELLTLYREAVRSVNNRRLPMDMILDHLKESGSAAGALVCDYDYFVVLCRSEARSMSRSGKAAHIALFSVSGAGDDDLAKRTLERTMDNLEEQIRSNLRRGDAMTRCSNCQFLVMLPQANYENSCMVCRRILTAFQSRYPQSPAVLRFTVQPLEPNI